MIDQNKLNDVLSYVNRYNEENGFPPTVRDICGALGIKSTATAYSYINRLREAGLLNKADGKKRAVALVGSDTVKVPLVGTVTAGQPILAVENYESFYALPSAEFHGDGLFLLRVRGESMIDAGILSGDIVVREKVESPETSAVTRVDSPAPAASSEAAQEHDVIKSTKTTIPFIKNHEFDYKWLSPFKGTFGWYCKWAIYVLMIVIVITACSNGTNLTDGLDGLSTGTSAIAGVVLGIFAWLSGNVINADYLNIMYIPGTGEIAVFMAAFVGALIGFLWYNSFPAQVFMGDTGSLARFYFKYTKKKYGTGRRIFKMAPLHHHFQKEGIPALIQVPKRGLPEAKITVRFWIIGIILAVITIAMLKIR